MWCIKVGLHYVKYSHELRKEDIPLVEIDMNVNFNQWNVFFSSFVQMFRLV